MMTGEKGNNMKLLRIRLNNGDEIVTRIMATFEEIASYYFPRKEVKEIEIIDGGIEESELCKRTMLKIYRASDDEIECGDLFYNIRMEYFEESKVGAFKPYITTCGLARI